MCLIMKGDNGVYGRECMLFHIKGVDAVSRDGRGRRGPVEVLDIAVFGD